MQKLVVSVVCAAALAAPVSAWAEEEDGDEGETRERTSLGIAPGELQVGDNLGQADDSGVSVATHGAYQFGFAGFLRVPMRVGFGGGSLHAPPRVPDGSYTDWQYTNTQTGPWTELRFSYGNGRVQANVHLAAYDVTDGSYANPQAQLGINESFVTLRFPDLFGDKGGLVWNVGAFSNRYGAAGRYSAGKYETYLFGATHVAGETVSMHWDLNDKYTILAEHGIGAKIQPTPLVPGLPAADFFPYPGEEQQGSTLVHHAHVGLEIDRMITVGAHYLTSWTDDAEAAGEEDGRVTSAGMDVRLTESRFGDGYIGYAHLESTTPQRLSGALEVLHTIAGWSVCDVYFLGSNECTGSVDTVLFQHVFSLSRFNWHPKAFWGQGPDLIVSAFGMYNKISSDDPTFTGPTSRLKLGGDVLYTPNKWLGIGARYDLVQPNLDDNTQSFQVIQPKLVLRSEFAGHEQIHITYSHYVNGDNVRVAYPHEGLPADDGVFQIIATMWW